MTAAQLIVKQERGGYSIPIDAATDARALHEVLISPMEPRPSDAGSILWLKWLREAHQFKCVRKALWTSTGDMLGDGLTKDKDQTDLINLFSSGKVALRYATLHGRKVIDGHKGRPPTKKEKEEQGYQLVESLFTAYFDA